MEKWVECFFNPKYECSNFGKVRNKSTKRELKFWDTNGYLYTWIGSVKINNETRKLKRSVHSIIAYSFLDYEEGKEIDHIDRDKKNNRLDNLRFVSKYENSINKDAKNYCIKHVNGYTYYETSFSTSLNQRLVERFKTEEEAVKRIECLRQKYR